MPKILIKRKRQCNHGMRSFGVYVDGKKLGKIGNGETNEFEVPEGDHHLKVKVDWCESNELAFTVEPGETRSFIIGGYKYADIISGITIAIVVAHFIFMNMYGILYIIWFAIPALLCNLYFVTIGRGSYLLLEEDKLSLSF